MLVESLSRRFLQCITMGYYCTLGPVQRLATVARARGVAAKRAVLSRGRPWALSFPERQLCLLNTSRIFKSE